MHLRVVRCVVLGSLLARSGGGKDGELTSPVAPSPVLTTVAVALSASSIAVGARRPSGGARAGDDRAVCSKARRPTPIEISIATESYVIQPWDRSCCTKRRGSDVRYDRWHMTTASILAFAGSARRDSWNRKVLAVAAVGAREAGAEVTVVNLGDYPMPIYDADWHAEQGVPPAALELRRLMMAANGLLIASPEYNASITPLLKNTIDWLSQSVDGASGRAPFEGKVGGLMGASSGAFGTIRALPHVSMILSNLGVLMRPVVAVPGVAKAFDESGAMTNDRTRQALSALGARVAGTIVKLG